MKAIYSLIILILINCSASTSIQLKSLKLESKQTAKNKLVAIVTYIFDLYNTNSNKFIDQSECESLKDNMFEILRIKEETAEKNLFCEEKKKQISLSELIVTFRSSLTSVLKLPGQTDNHLIQGLIDAFYSRWANKKGLTEKQFIIVMSDLYNLLKLKSNVEEFKNTFKVTSIINSKFMEDDEFFIFVQNFLSTIIPNFI